MTKATGTQGSLHETDPGAREHTPRGLSVSVTGGIPEKKNAPEAEIDRLKRENAELRAQCSHLQASVKARFFEIAQLTRLLRQGPAILSQIAKASMGKAGARPEEKTTKFSDAVSRAIQLLAQHSAGNALALQQYRSADRKTAATEATQTLDNIALLKDSGLFDAVWYRTHYGDPRLAGMDPAEHYLLHGAKEGKNPSPLFDAASYLQEYPDVAQSGYNPLLHYIYFGYAEARTIKIVKSDIHG